MLCIACAKPGRPLCATCERGLAVTHDRVVSGVHVGVAFEHTGTAARLVHNLKYRRSVAAGDLLARAMARRIPNQATSLVPVRRSFVRNVGFGIDQAYVLSRSLARIVDLPVYDVLVPPLWWRRRAGAPRAGRTPVAFRARSPVPGGAVLVDDVLTTGSTLTSAGCAIEPATYTFLVATAAGRMGAGADVASQAGGDVAEKRRTRGDGAPAAQSPSQRVQPAWPLVRRASTGVPQERSTGDRSYPR